MDAPDTEETLDTVDSTDVPLSRFEVNGFQHIPLDSFTIPSNPMYGKTAHTSVLASVNEIPGGSMKKTGETLAPVYSELPAPSTELTDEVAAEVAAGVAALEVVPENPAEISPADAEHLASPEPVADSPMKIWVKDPEKVEVANKFGLKTAHYTYLVRTESILATFNTTGTEVRRRFSEFDALYKLLKSSYRGYFTPALPEKSFVESKFASESFLKLRTVDLQAFLRAVAAHPVLRESEELRVFLSCVSELQMSPQWSSMLQHSKAMEKWRAVFGVASGELAADASSAGKPFMPSLLVKLKSNLGMLPVKREFTDEELQLRQAREELREMLRTLQVACDQARSMVQHIEALCEDYAELGRTFNVMTRCEEHAALQTGQYTEDGQNCTKRAADMQQLSYSNLRYYNLLKHHSVKTAASLVTMHDYCTLLPEAIAALEEREVLLNSIHVMEAELENKQHQLAEVKDGHQRQVINFTSSEKRVTSLQQTIVQLEEDIKTAHEFHKLLTERNKSELSRLGLNRTSDFHSMGRAYTKAQAQLFQASADLWMSAAEQFTAPRE